MLILGSTILVPPGNQGCAQKLHKKVKFKKNIFICFCMPIQVGKLYKSWNMVTMIRLPKFVLNSWYLVGGLCTRVGPIWWQWMKSSKTFFSLTNLKKKDFFSNLEMLALRLMIWDLGWDQNDCLIKYRNLLISDLLEKIHTFVHVWCSWTFFQP